MKLKPMMIKILLISSASMLLTACAATEAIQKPTASGKPEQTFRLPADQVCTLIEAACNTNGMATERSGNAVICSRERKGIVGNAAVSVAMGNIDYAAPVFKERYTVIPWANGEQSKVFVDYWTEIAGNFGHQHRSEMNAGGKWHNNIQKGLDEMKAAIDKLPANKRQPENNQIIDLIPQ